jgi:hypothetical protein
MSTHKGTHRWVAFATASLVVIACGSSDTSDFMGSGSTGTGGSGGAEGTTGTGGAAGSSSMTGSGGTTASGGATGIGGTNGASGAGGMSANGGAGSVVPDAGMRPDGAPACAGIECTVFPGTLAAAPRDATNLTNCVIQMHELDCCGTRAAYGINHGGRTTLCPAEMTCVASYPTPPPCTNATITTDTGEKTTNEADVKLRCVPVVGGATCKCETFVCVTDVCRAAPGIAGGCGQ